MITIIEIPIPNLFAIGNTLIDVLGVEAVMTIVAISAILLNLVLIQEIFLLKFPSRRKGKVQEKD